MTNEEAKAVLEGYRDNPLVNDKEAFNVAIKALESQKWIPIKTRPMTEEEIQEHECDYGFIYNCSLPDDGQDTLIQTPFGIRFATFYNDTQYGCYWEGYEDDGDVLAWMPLPQPYKAEGSKSE